ncbi:MAG: hypothetical protein JW892_12730 [Anaerolineae bacterium]|nr:hypothetical protein [Anaerolineae bacterium]
MQEYVKPSTRSEWLAYWISNVGSPPMMALAGLIVTATLLPSEGIWRWIAIYTVFAIAIPMGYLGYLLRRGHISDMDVTRREQRTRPLIITLGGLLVAEILFILGEAPLPFRILAGASLVQGALVFLITLQWKISMHTSTAAGMTVLILSIAGLAAAPVAITVPLIAWSRVKLRRHTLMQTLAGICLGVGVFLIVILLTTTA